MKLAVIGGGDFQLPGIKKAKGMGYEVHVFSWEADRKNVEDCCDYFYPISVNDRETILSKCKELNIDGVLAICSDLCELTSAYVAKALNLSGSNDLNVVEISTNKNLMREKFLSAKVRSPQFRKIDNEESFFKAIELIPSNTLILKPADRSGSRGVIKFLKNTNRDELKRNFEISIRESFSRTCIVEEYVEGIEFSVEMFSVNGNHHLIAVTQKITTGAPHFIELGHIQPPISLSLAEIKEIQSVAISSLNALEIKNGPSHVELKIDGGKATIIEVGPRMGGDFIGSHLTCLSSGFDYLSATIDMKLGTFKNMNAYQVKKHKYSFSLFGFSRKVGKISGMQVHGIKDFFKVEEKIESESLKITSDSSSRVGYIIGVCNSHIDQDISLEVMYEA